MLSYIFCRLSNGRKIYNRRAQCLSREVGNSKGKNGPPQNPHHKIPEINGPKGKEPTRFGDWESKGKTSDF